MAIRSPQRTVPENRLDKSCPLEPSGRGLFNGSSTFVALAHRTARPTARPGRPGGGAEGQGGSPGGPTSQAIYLTPCQGVRCQGCHSYRPPPLLPPRGTALGIEDVATRSPQRTVPENRLDKSCPLEPSGRDLFNGLSKFAAFAHRAARSTARSGRPRAAKWAPGAFEVGVGQVANTYQYVPWLDNRVFAPGAPRATRVLLPTGAWESRMWRSGAHNAPFPTTD